MKVEVSPGKFVDVSNEMMQKAKQALVRTNELLEIFDQDFPEPKCDICGRVIYCGVDSVCGLDPCGLKKV